VYSLWRIVVNKETDGLGSRLRLLRDKADQSLQQVADAVGASKAHIWEIETGRSQNPSIDLVRRLAGHYSVTVGWLLGEQADRTAPDQRAAVLYAAARDLGDDDFTLLESIVETLRRRSGVTI
jgi:transcriptional regulator with XRE-family HTH domain